MTTRPYQVRCCQALTRSLQEYNRVLVESATGTGKTYTMATWIHQTEGRHLVIVSGNDLVAQLVTSLESLTGEHVGIEKAGETAHDSLARMVVASVESIRSDKRLARYLETHFDYLHIDEAHLSAADSYVKVFTHFQAKMILWTATGFRTDKKKLPYDFVAFRYPYRAAVEEGWLVPVVFERIPLKIDARGVKIRGGDYDLNMIDHAIEPYLEAACAEICKRSHGKWMVFLPLVNTSMKMCDMLNRMGMRAAHVDGTMGDRSEIITGFKDGRYNCLTNAQIFSVGTDLPVADHLMNLRMTKSLVRYIQTCGRVLRPLTEITTALNGAVDAEARHRIIAESAKPHATIVDPLWLTKKHNLCEPPELIAASPHEARIIKAEYAASGKVNLSKSIDRAANTKVSTSMTDELERNSKKRAEIDSIGLRKYGIDLTEYKPRVEWERDPISDKQREWLEKQHISTAGLNKGSAKVIMDAIIQGNNATPAQVRMLKRWGINGEGWSKEAASATIDKKMKRYKK